MGNGEICKYLSRFSYIMYMRVFVVSVCTY